MLMLQSSLDALGGAIALIVEVSLSADNNCLKNKVCSKSCSW